MRGKRGRFYFPSIGGAKKQNRPLFILDRGKYPCHNTMKINTYTFNFRGINLYDQKAKP
jgi:hypothetical protein